MNRKIFAALLIFPVALFATDRFVSTPGGGGKGKNKTKQATVQTTNQAGIAAPVQQQTVLHEQETEPVKVSSAEATNFEFMVKELTASLDKMDEEKDGIFDREIESVKYSKNLDPKTADNLKKLLGRLRKENPINLDFSRSFSRCGTGYNIYVFKGETVKINEAAMIYHSGCRDVVISKIQYDENASNITAKISDKVGYVPINTFFKVLKEVKA